MLSIHLSDGTAWFAVAPDGKSFPIERLCRDLQARIEAAPVGMLTTTPAEKDPSP
jgi:hypothetical protein